MSPRAITHLARTEQTFDLVILATETTAAANSDRLLTNGTPLLEVLDVAGPYGTASRSDLGHSMANAEAFWKKVRRAGADECWQWTGPLSSGYGRFHVFEVDGTRHQSVCAHRVAYMLCVGAIPLGMELDHLCRNKACVNPAHLEPVTHAENVARAYVESKARTHCQLGHELTPDNVFYAPAGNGRGDRERGYRRCTTCYRATLRKRRQRLKMLSFDPPYVCPVCQRESASYRGLAMHYKAMHVTEVAS